MRLQRPPRAPFRYGEAPHIVHTRRQGGTRQETGARCSCRPALNRQMSVTCVTCVAYGNVRHAHLPATHVTIVPEDPGAIRGRVARRGFRNKSCSLFLKIRCASRAYD